MYMGGFLIKTCDFQDFAMRLNQAASGLLLLDNLMHSAGTQLVADIRRHAAFDGPLDELQVQPPDDTDRFWRTL